MTPLKTLSLIYVAILIVLAIVLRGWWLPPAGSPSFMERFERSNDIMSCVERSGCWDYARQGCIFAKTASGNELPPTPEQAATDRCHPNGDGDRLSEETKHLRLW